MKSFIAKLTLGAAAFALAGTASAKIPPEAPEDPGAVHSYILLDRTGSMSNIWEEALGSVNAYAASVGEADEGEIDGEDIETDVTLAVFDFQEGMQFDVLRDSVKAEDWENVTDDEANPRGMTPLFDAIGRMVSLAEADQPEKAVIVIMTDGLENSSRELTKDGAKAALDRARAKGWEVVFLGAEFASFDDAESVGMDARKTMAVGQGSMQESMSALAKKSRAYGKGEEAEIEFNEEDRALADEEGVKERQNR
ncbi:VWA domain-containing protein [Hyphomonas sp.]|uniref:VWA domain-containing protein n=1 Tax=Hyphomonas sp. TaxID=87 RepID=UPI003242155A